ncbi:MAG: biotin/lipoyl-binding protein [Acidobacteriales bacterium]|nr:biotin/lipoyl-binding protein [Terriglobales bacterium]
MIYEVNVGTSTFRVELTAANGSWRCRLSSPGGGTHEMEIDAMLSPGDVLSLLVGGRSYEVRRDSQAGEIILQGQRFPVEVRDLRSLRGRRRAGQAGEGPKKVVAPMPGKIVRVLVAERSEVEAGQGIVVVEAMKMQNELKAPKKGVVTKLLVSEGAAVNAGDALAVIA